VKLDKKAGVGTLDCKICGQKFQCGINCTTPTILLHFVT
jgi:transcription elongation factor Elf1